MVLAYAELLFGTIFLLSGTAFLCFPDRSLKILRVGIRSPTANWICFAPALIWFLWYITQLGEADFGKYKDFFFTFFAMVGLIALLHVRDFLVVRGACILTLLTAHELLEAAYMENDIARLWMVSGIYLSIVIAIYWGALPYRLRDFLDWFQNKRGFFYTRLLGILLASYGYKVLATIP
ncbi:MAG: hypothetical protein LBD40_01220 [Puniceicoccales bacterium]|jgi:hypothetical protein|nr:hypothetical protein [Puniceicoccales bacterium]